MQSSADDQLIVSFFSINHVKTTMIVFEKVIGPKRRNNTLYKASTAGDVI